MSWKEKEKRLYEQAAIDPELVYSSPEQLLVDHLLSKEHKIDLLRRWAHEMLDIANANSENMAGSENMIGKESDLFDRIMKALYELGAELDGHPRS